MNNRPKIKILDDDISRNKLNNAYNSMPQTTIVTCSINLAKHIFKIIDYRYINKPLICDAFSNIKLWQKNKTTVYEVRKSAFLVHALAKQTKNEIIKTALRVTGHAISTAHMKAHGIVASDYAIKTINLLFPNNPNPVRAERLWQLSNLLN